MAKQTGLGDNLWVDGVDLSGDVGSASEVGGGNSPLVVTGIDKFAPERIGGLLDGRINFTAFFNDALGPPAQAHQTLRTRPTTDRVVSYAKGPQGIGSQVFSMEAKQINYDGTRGDDGSFTFDVEAQSTDFGGMWGTLLTAGKRTDTAPTNGAGVDFGAASVHGMRIWFHCFAFTGTSVTITVQESQDNGGADPYATALGGFAVAVFSAPGALMIGNSSSAIERWLRVITTGTFTSATFAVIVERPAVATFPQ